MNELNEYQLDTYLETFEDEKDNLNDYNEFIILNDIGSNTEGSSIKIYDIINDKFKYDFMPSL